MPSENEIAHSAKAWPFAEARELASRIGQAAPAKGYVLFETGYGPSGLPHIGTFGEVVRTNMVRHAFTVLSPLPTRLSPFPTTWMGCAACPTTSPTATSWPSTSVSP